MKHACICILVKLHAAVMCWFLRADDSGDASGAEGMEDIG